MALKGARMKPLETKPVLNEVEEFYFKVVTFCGNDFAKITTFCKLHGFTNSEIIDTIEVIFFIFQKVE